MIISQSIVVYNIKGVLLKTEKFGVAQGQKWRSIIFFEGETRENI